MNICLGIDPGWKNFGMAASTWDEKTGEIKLINSWVLCPAKTTIPSFVYNLGRIIPDEIDYVCIERFIAYKGVDSAEFEIINRLIGALEYYFVEGRGEENRPELRLYRAIDWKMGLVKALHIREGFDNPSDKLDKKFSIAAAHAVLKSPTPLKIKTDHEADAICLSAVPKYLKG